MDFIDKIKENGKRLEPIIANIIILRRHYIPLRSHRDDYLIFELDLTTILIEQMKAIFMKLFNSVYSQKIRI